MLRVNRHSILGTIRDMGSSLVSAWKRDLSDVLNDRFRLPDEAAIEADLLACEDCGRCVIQCRCGGRE